MKDQLVFNVTDANTIADSDSVGAFVRSSDGTLIDHKTIDSAEWLNVASALFDGSGNAIDSVSGALKVYIDDGDFAIDVNLDGVYNVGTNADPDNVGMIAHVRNAAPGDAQQTFRPTGGQPNADDVDPANVFGLDVNAFGQLWDGSAWDRAQGVAGAAKVYIDDQNGDVDVNVTNTNLSVNDAALANTSIANGSTTLSAANTAQDVVASPLTDRKYLYLYNNDTRRMFIGASGVSSADGFPVSPRSYVELRAGASVDIEYVSPKVGHDLRYLELS